MILSNLIAQTDPFGKIAAPEGVDRFGATTDNIGILVFASRLIQLFTVVAGLYVMFNLLTAGWNYITGSGDSGIHSKVANKITNSVIGLVIIVAAYAIIAAIGLLFFGKATYFLNPEIIAP